MRQGLTWPLLAAVVMAAGCGLGGRPDAHPTPRASTGPPCAGTPAASTELGSPFRDSSPARFQTDGGPLFITARHFSHGGLFEDLAPRSTAVYIGPEAAPPSYDPQRGTVTPLTIQLRVVEDEWVAFQIPDGRYWLLTSAGGDLEIVSCTPDGVTGQAPPPYTDPSSKTPSPPAPATPSTTAHDRRTWPVGGPPGRCSSRAEKQLAGLGQVVMPAFRGVRGGRRPRRRVRAGRAVARGVRRCGPRP